LKPSCLIWFVNVDATIFASSSSLAIKVAFRNYMGARLLAYHKSRNGISSSEIAEALALRYVVVLALEESFHSMVLQSDCLALILKTNAPVTAVRYRTTAGFK
jgi:hypothetical protein